MATAHNFDAAEPDFLMLWGVVGLVQPLMLCYSHFPFILHATALPKLAANFCCQLIYLIYVARILVFELDTYEVPFRRNLDKNRQTYVVGR